MKKIFLSAMVMAFGLANAQSEEVSAYTGKGDLRLNVGANIQSNATGVVTSLDYGFGQSFSLGVQAGYLLSVPNDETLGGKPKIGDRFEVKVRANAHLGQVIGLPANLDVYPGLNLSLKNFGGHLGARYFFGKGFGVFTELQFPLARYNDGAKGYELLNNQFGVLVGASFDLNLK
ncbi:MAG: hypothetical protein CSA38_05505 [Flavobacteriales bacterium]|nr:MAG: hypothetical protein CSA38_05505 [Flavobacteriales bacterium]